MKNTHINIRHEDLHFRNEMHFDVQLKCRAAVHKSKNDFNRAKLKRELHREIAYM